MEVEPAGAVDERLLRMAEEFVQRCNAESDPYLYALACAAQPLDPDEAPIRWLEVNPLDGSFVVHSLLVEVEGGERMVVAAHQVEWKEE